VFDSNLTTLASSVTLTPDYVSTRPRHRPPTRSFHSKAYIGQEGRHQDTVFRHPVKDATVNAEASLYVPRPLCWSKSHFRSTQLWV
jgi:hypothetical protein